MEYSPYTPYSPISNNATPITEEFTDRGRSWSSYKNDAARISRISRVYSRFENGKNTAIINQDEIQKLLKENAELQQHKKYKKYIPFNGKDRPTAVDELLRDKLQLNDTYNQTYILGTIAVASLVILSFYI